MASTKSMEKNQRVTEHQPMDMERQRVDMERQRVDMERQRVVTMHTLQKAMMHQ
jgi:hypothetical protein